MAYGKKFSKRRTSKKSFKKRGKKKPYSQKRLGTYRIARGGGRL